MASPYVGDNLIYANAADAAGGGIEISGYADAQSSHGTWVNNTIADNTAGYRGSQISVEQTARKAVIVNNAITASDGSIAIFCWGKDAQTRLAFENNDIYTQGDTLVDGSCAAGALVGTNLSVAPAYARGANGHPYHLAPKSPLIDAGSNEAARRLHHDLGMRPRIIDGGHGPTVDIGAYEYQPAQ